MVGREKVQQPLEYGLILGGNKQTKYINHQGARFVYMPVVYLATTQQFHGSWYITVISMREIWP